MKNLLFGNNLKRNNTVVLEAELMDYKVSRKIASKSRNNNN